jgi:hypothetical protein
MSNYAGTIDISRIPELLDLVKEVAETKKPKALTRDNRVVALLSPVEANTATDTDSSNTFTRSLAAIGSWSDLDASDVTRKVAKWRDVGSRP